MPCKYVPVGWNDYDKSGKSPGITFVSTTIIVVFYDCRLEKQFFKEVYSVFSALNRKKSATFELFSPHFATLEKHRRAVPKGKEIRS